MAVLWASPTSSLTGARAAELTGMTADLPKRIVQIGAGTIGSMAAEIMARQGVGTHWTIIDPDYLLPHNLARHDAARFRGRHAQSDGTGESS